MDGGAWWAAVHGVAESWTQLSNFTFTFHFHSLEKEMGTHSSVLAWRVPGTVESGGLPSMGSHRVGHAWSNLAAAAAAFYFWNKKSLKQQFVTIKHLGTVIKNLFTSFQLIFMIDVKHTVAILQMWKLRFKELKWFAQASKCSKQRSLDSNWFKKCFKLCWPQSPGTQLLYYAGASSILPPFIQKVFNIYELNTWWYN